MGKVRDWVKTSVEDKFRKLCTEAVASRGGIDHVGERKRERRESGSSR